MDLNDYSEKKSLPWKPIALIAGGVILLIVVVFVVVRLIQNARQEEVLVQNGGTDELTACETAANPDGCREGLVEDLAASEGSEELCELLEAQEDQDNCYWSVARANQDVKPCSSISVPEDAQRCADGVMEAQALEVADPALCAQIGDAARASRCEESIAGPLTSENCADRRPDACADIALFEEATATLEVEICEGIVDESIRLSCYDAVEDTLAREPNQDVDTDQDGLTDEEEEVYGTDPENSDTDGDSYLDGDEVAAGYDPNGPGKLE
ncbi:MAG TPA: hypothetical protein VJB64_02680 [Patescibacteria group bacterium]|nr:hypothetical protein [Patescibacteria group bacterium]